MIPEVGGGGAPSEGPGSDAFVGKKADGVDGIATCEAFMRWLAADVEPSVLQLALQDLSEEDAQALYLDLLYDWRTWARAEQREPMAEYATWACIAGRGGGKTWTGGHWTNDKANRYPGCRIMLLGSTKGDVRDVMVEDSQSGILATAHPDRRPVYLPSLRRLEWPNGSVATTFSADEPEQTRGPNGHFAWVDELAKFRDPKGGTVKAWDNLRFAVRLKVAPGQAWTCRPQILVTTTPRRVGRGAELVKDLVLGKKVAGKRPMTAPVGDPVAWSPRERVFVHRWSTDRNAKNLADDFMTELDATYAGTTIERQERAGEILDEVEGALFKIEDIDKARVDGVPTMVEVLVSIDPSHASEGQGPDDAGIIVGGLGDDGDAYIWDDATLRGSPLRWARAGLQAHNENRADAIVIEVTAVHSDKKGHPVKDTMKAVDPDNKIRWIEIHASADKAARARPVAALYEQGRVHHVTNPRNPDRLAALEDEMVTWDPASNESPNRLDAMVQLVTRLLLKDKRGPLVAR